MGTDQQRSAKPIEGRAEAARTEIVLAVGTPPATRAVACGTVPTVAAGVTTSSGAVHDRLQSGRSLWKTREIEKPDRTEIALEERSADAPPILCLQPADDVRRLEESLPVDEQTGHLPSPGPLTQLGSPAAAHAHVSMLEDVVD